MHLMIDTPAFAVTVISTCLSRGNVHVSACPIYCSVTETVHEGKCSPGPFTKLSLNGVSGEPYNVYIHKLQFNLILLFKS